MEPDSARRMDADGGHRDLLQLSLGYGVRNAKRERNLLLMLPLVVSISFLLIADIDSPRGGLIHVRPLNLESLAETLHPH